jgi:hypothetical protein
MGRQARKLLGQKFAQMPFLFAVRAWTCGSAAKNSSSDQTQRDMRACTNFILWQVAMIIDGSKNEKKFEDSLIKC